MGNWSSVPKARGQRRHIQAKSGSRLARALSPLLLMGVFVHCAAEDAAIEELPAPTEEAAPEAESSSEFESNLDLESSNIAADEGDSVEFEGDLGQLTQALEPGAPCTAGQNACNGNKRQLCLGGIVIQQDCGSNVCFAGACRACTPGARTCVGNSAQVCAADGSRILSTTGCVFGCSAGRCRACSPESAIACTSNIARRCSSDGLSIITTACPRGCGTNRQCRP
jgi:hypothetical protein